MKKKIMMLLPFLGVVCLSSCGVRVTTNHAATVEANLGSIQIKDEHEEKMSFEVSIPEEILDGRSVDERWREHSCSIKADQIDKQHRYYSYEPGDYIYNVEYSLKQPFANGYVIYWNANFYIWDDMEVQFEFSNGYRTRVETTHNPLGKDEIVIPREDCWKFGLKFETISKVFVRTID